MDDGKRRTTLGSQDVGSFRVLRLLGSGSFGVVYLVHDQETDELCAIKVLKNGSGEAATRFRAEAKTWLAIPPHPHVVSAQRIAVINDQVVLALDFIPPSENGIGNVQDLIARRRATPQLAIRLAIQICEGLAFVRHHGLQAHCDIKPANVLVDPTGNALVTDFGLARFVSHEWPQLSSAEGSAGGTLLYMAPEQFRDGAVDQRADIYAVGLVVYELLTGLSPYQWSALRGRRPELVALDNHTNAQPRPCSGPAWPVIARCLEKDPSKRWPSFEPLAEALGRVYQSLAGKSYVSAPVSHGAAHRLMNRSASFLVLGELRVALELANQAALIIPGYPPLETNRGAILAGLGDIQSAVRIWRRVVKEHPDTSRAFYNLGNVERDANNLADAVKNYEQCLVFEPSYVPALINLAIAKTTLKDFDRANALYQSAAECEPDNAAVHYNHGVFLAQHGRPREAIDSLEACLRLMPERVAAMNHLGNCLGALGDLEGARHWFHKCLELSPGYKYALENLERLGLNEASKSAVTKEPSVWSRLFFGDR